MIKVINKNSKEKEEIVNVEAIDFINKVINYIDNDYENNRQELGD